MFWKIFALTLILGTLVSCNAKLDVSISGDASKIGAPAPSPNSEVRSPAQEPVQKKVTFSGTSD